MVAEREEKAAKAQRKKKDKESADGAPSSQPAAAGADDREKKKPKIMIPKELNEDFLELAKAIQAASSTSSSGSSSGASAGGLSIKERAAVHKRLAEFLPWGLQTIKVRPRRDCVQAG